MSISTLPARRATRVAMDPETHADVFPCTVPEGVCWNGWACPTFDLPTAERVVAWQERNGDEYQCFRWTTDRDGARTLLMGYAPDGDGQPEWEVAGTERDGFSIGAFCWTWQEVGDLPTDPAAIDAALAEQNAHVVAYCRTWNAALRASYEEVPGDYARAAAAAQSAVAAAGLNS